MPRRNEPIKRVTRADGSTVYRLRTDGPPRADGSRRQVSASFPSRKAARDELARIRAAVADNRYVARDGITVREQFDGWLAGKRGIRPSTRQGYLGVTGRFLAVHGEMPVQWLTKETLDGWVNALLEEGRSPHTIRDFVAALRQPLDLAVAQNRLAMNPARLLEIPQTPIADPVVWTPEEVQAFLAVASTDRLYACWLMTMAGMRRGEVLARRWPDTADGQLIIDSNRVLVGSDVLEGDPKTRRGFRILPMWGALDEALEARRSAETAERALLGEWGGGDLIAVEADGTPVGPRRYSERFKALAYRAGIKRIPLKNARHTSITNMRNAGVPDHLVAAWHGHDESVMRSAYTAVSQEALGTVAEAVQAVCATGSEMPLHSIAS